MNQAKRYDQNKNRLDLVPPVLLEEVGKVLTFGCAKYNENDWMSGMKWRKCIGSLKRHLNEYEKGVDYDSESGLLHLSHLITNAMFLLEYYKSCPELDNRLYVNKKQPRIALDIDEVIADWIGHWTRYHKQDLPSFWNFDMDIASKFEILKDNKEFWLSIPPKLDAKDLPLEPVAYITSRMIPTSWTEEWIQKNGFPCVPVYTVKHLESKVDIIKSLDIDWFIDDREMNFNELNEAGICCFLMDAKHNQHVSAGYKRIKDFNDFKDRFL